MIEWEPGPDAVRGLEMADHNRGVTLEDFARAERRGRAAAAAVLDGLLSRRLVVEVRQAGRDPRYRTTHPGRRALIHLGGEAAKAAKARALDRRLVEREAMRPLFFGQAPGRGRLDRYPALTGATGDRLGKLAGLDEQGFRPALGLMLATERTNVFDRLPPVPSGTKADPFPMAEAKRRAVAILGRYARAGTLRGREVVFAGRKVAEAFGVGDWPLFEWRPYRLWVAEAHPFEAAVVPHPSGRNRFWNDPANREQARVFLSALFAETEETA